MAAPKILLVDDQPINVQLLKRKLEREGITIFTAMVARLGAPQMAATNAVIQVWSLPLMLAFAVSVTATTLSGQAVGAGEPDTARLATRRILLVGGIPMAALCALFLAVPEWLISLFADGADAEQLAPYARPLFVIAVIFMMFDLPFNGLSGALRGAGDTKFPMYVSIAVSWLAFVPAVWFVSPRFGVVGAYPAGQDPDTRTPLLGGMRRHAEAIAWVPLPASDPVFGAQGPLFEHWRA